MQDPKLKHLLEIPTISTVIYAKATYYPNFVRIYIPKEPYPKHPEGFEKPATKGSLRTQADELDETDTERSIRRTRKKIKDYVLCNEFELFATFTFKNDRQNIDRCKTRMADWLKNQRSRISKFDYIIVPEFHKDKQSLHFHALFRGYKGKLVQSLNATTAQPIKQNGHNVYEIPGYTLGFTNVKIIDKNIDSQTKVGFYIQKYITKDMPLFFGKNRYWNSKGLNLPKTEDNPQEWYKHIKPDREYRNDNGVILEFDKLSHPLTSIFSEARQ